VDSDILVELVALLPVLEEGGIFGDAPPIVVVSLKDGPVSSELLDEIIRPQDLVLRMPVLDQSLAAALDASNATWLDILEVRWTATACLAIRW